MSRDKALVYLLLFGNGAVLLFYLFTALSAPKNHFRYCIITLFALFAEYVGLGNHYGLSRGAAPVHCRRSVAFFQFLPPVLFRVLLSPVAASVPYGTWQLLTMTNFL